MKKLFYQSKKHLFIFAVTLFAIIVLPLRTEAAPYTYTNTEYGFSITCPDKPQGIISLNRTRDEKGVLLVFEGDANEVKYGWLILVDAFTDKDMPKLKDMPTQELDAYMQLLLHNGANEVVAVVPIEEEPALYTINKGEKKEAVTYIQSKRNYMVTLISPMDKFKERINPYQEGLISFKSK